MGIFEKMKGQGKALNDLQREVEYLYIDRKNCVRQTESTTDILDQGIFHGWTKYKRIFLTLSRLLDTKSYDLILIRHLVFTTPLYQALKKAKEKKTMIAYEFPCWPYEKEWSKGMGSLLMSIDHRNRDRCLNCLDVVIHYGGFNCASISAIQMSNGLYVEEHYLNTRTPQFTEDTPLRLIAVGKWASWHGLDRVIRGMTHKSNAILDVIGEGPASSSLKRLVAGKRLNNVHFHGQKHGADLTQMLHHAHIGIGTLGIHRKGVKLNSSLKHRLYCAHGLPFILSSSDLDFHREWPFCLYESKDDAKIKIKEIRDWYTKLIMDHPDHHQQLHTYAKENLGWTKQMKKLLERL